MFLQNDIKKTGWKLPREAATAEDAGISVRYRLCFSRDFQTPEKLKVTASIIVTDIIIAFIYFFYILNQIVFTQQHQTLNYLKILFPLYSWNQFLTLFSMFQIYFVMKKKNNWKKNSNFFPQVTIIHVHMEKYLSSCSQHFTQICFKSRVL